MHSTVKPVCVLWLVLYTMSQKSCTFLFLALLYQTWLEVVQQHNLSVVANSVPHCVHILVSNNGENH